MADGPLKKGKSFASSVEYIYIDLYIIPCPVSIEAFPRMTRNLTSS